MDQRSKRGKADVGNVKAVRWDECKVDIFVKLPIFKCQNFSFLIKLKCVFERWRIAVIVTIVSRKSLGRQCEVTR